MEAENRELKKALADASLAKSALETLIEVIDEHYQTDVKKKLGQQPLSGHQGKKGEV